MFNQVDLLELYDAPETDTFSAGRGLELLSARKFWLDYGTESPFDRSDLQQHASLAGLDAKRYLTAGRFMDDRELFVHALEANLSVDTISFLADKTNHLENWEDRLACMREILADAAANKTANRTSLAGEVKLWLERAVEAGVAIKQKVSRALTPAKPRVEEPAMKDLLDDDASDIGFAVDYMAQKDGTVSVRIDLTKSQWRILSRLGICFLANHTELTPRQALGVVCFFGVKHLLEQKEDQMKILNQWREQDRADARAKYNRKQKRRRKR
ncbi:MAG: hypothetical protein Q3962_04175 [Corynebacterium sp.]|nr:hypothetical protein [Corynebacterium sp.]